MTISIFSEIIYTICLLYTSKDGLAICEDGYGTLWYTEIPEEFAEVGSAIGLEDLQELSELPLPLQKKIMEELDNMPKELTDELLGLEVIE